MILLRSPRSLRSTGFSHTDSCMVGLKKKTLSSPVQTTHLQTQELRRLKITQHTHTCTHAKTNTHILSKETDWVIGPILLFFLPLIFF